MTINVLLADDHTIVRDGLRALLEANPEIKVVGDAATGLQAVSQARELQPDILVMDISMPDLNGIDATRQILEACPQVRVIILSMLGTADHVFHALSKCGDIKNQQEDASGQAVYAGEMSSHPSRTMVNDYASACESQTDSLQSLSLRENEILCKGEENIAELRVCFRRTISRTEAG
jgi:two-component system response regulator NreC